jgi:hypothetical protein
LFAVIAESEVTAAVGIAAGYCKPGHAAVVDIASYHDFSIRLCGYSGCYRTAKININIQVYDSIYIKPCQGKPLIPKTPSLKKRARESRVPSCNST